MLNKQEQQRYLRQLILSDFGEKAQERLKKSTAFVAGAGGLGAPVCLYLAAAGVGHIIIADRDQVDLSNLNRQLLHNTQDIGVEKSASALNTLSALNPEITLEVHHCTINVESLERMASEADLLIDCLDNIPTRLDLNQFSIKNNIPIMHGGIDQWAGQISFIHSPETACLHCLFEDFVEDKGPKPVLGAVAGVIGSMQALESIKYLAGMSLELKNQLAYFDGLTMEWTKIPLFKNEHCPVCSKASKGLG